MRGTPTVCLKGGLLCQPAFKPCLCTVESVRAMHCYSEDNNGEECLANLAREVAFPCCLEDGLA